jgi:hypothetical protein
MPAGRDVTDEQARATVGDEPIYCQTQLRGASNGKAKELLMSGSNYACLARSAQAIL